MRERILCPATVILPAFMRRDPIRSADLGPGALVYYGGGPSALAMVETPHAGGWHGRQCCGGTVFVCDNTSHMGLYLANADDWKVWVAARHWRGETPRRKPHLLRTETGRWQCYDHITSRVHDSLQRAFDYHREAIRA